MRYLTLKEILDLHRMVLAQSGGAEGIQDQGRLESSLAQPALTFAGQDLYPTLVEKAAVLCFSLVMNHAFVDGNKRIGHFAMEVFLRLNGKEVDAPVDEQEQVILRLAAGELKREEFTEWLHSHVVDH
jgi:death-on-curing protein